jgi:hypothetical protein
MNVTFYFSPNGVEYFPSSTIYHYTSTCMTENERECSGRGRCIGTRCYCDSNFKGDQCEICSRDCSGDHGKCSNKDGKCICSPGFFGEICQFHQTFWIFIFSSFLILLLFLISLSIILYFMKRNQFKFKFDVGNSL